MKVWKNILILFICCLPAIGLSQISFSGRSKICLGDITKFQYTPLAGQTLNSAKWELGDGFTSSQNSPNHRYKDTGRKLVKVTAITSGGTISETLWVEIVGLPVAKLLLSNLSQYCFLGNSVCFQDSSRPNNSNQPIDSHLLIWGDGAFTKYTSSSSSFNCHNYKKEGKYTASLEVEDRYGCKAFDKKDITILPDVNTRFDVNIKYPNCKEAIVCVKNKSTESPSSIVSYLWDLDGRSTTLEYRDSSYCFNVLNAKSIALKLFASAKDGCKDTSNITRVIKFDTIVTKIKSSSNNLCYNGGSILFELERNKNHAVTWYVDNVLVSSLSNDSLRLKFKDRYLAPGKHKLLYKVRGNSCSKTFEYEFNVLGPRAQIELYFNKQCNTNERVYFTSSSIYFDSLNTVMFWNIGDSFGNKCTNKRIQDINLFKNCNYSTDWYTKHDFLKPEGTYPVIYIIMDTLTGCSDTAIDSIYFDKCKDSLVCNDTFTLCQNQLFTPGSNKNIFKVSFNKGLSWQKAPFKLGDKLRGIVPVSYILKDSINRNVFDFGDDSIKLEQRDTVIYDTVFCNTYLRIIDNGKDSIYLTKGVSCNQKTVNLHFANGTFYAGEKITINWEPNNTQIIHFKRDTVIKKITRIYNVKLNDYTFTVIRERADSLCMTSYNTILNIGHGTILSYSGTTCAKSEFCFRGRVYNYEKGRYYFQSNPDYKTELWIDNLLLDTLKYNRCHIIPNGGLHIVKFVSIDKQGCSDTAVDSLWLQQPIANVKKESRLFYCNQIRQFFDSSSLILKGTNDSIVSYFWQFDNNNFKSTLKDPFHSFVGETDDVNAYHSVETLNGCKDTLFLKIKLIGPKPYFTLSDSIGCSPFSLTFINASLKSSSYIWEFNDSNKQTIATNKDTSIVFTYSKPGTYYPELVAIDTVFNPSTSSVYFCNATFPKDTASRRVIVLPAYNTELTGPDTLCINEVGKFISHSDKEFHYDYWDMGDGDNFQLSTGKTNPYAYLSAGNYKVHLKPFYPTNPKYPSCMDTAMKDVVVLGVNAFFEIDKPIIFPEVTFTNKSSSFKANFEWDYGNPKSGNRNSSNSIDGMHNYGQDTGWYKVCLISSIPAGCEDTFCKDIYNDYIEGIALYNVFTPGNSDGINDFYDVHIVGEDFYNLKIVNRWGQLVFESHEDEYNWNGKVFNEGLESPSGTYYYVFTYSWNYDPTKRLTVNGVVTLIRE